MDLAYTALAEQRITGCGRTPVLVAHTFVVVIAFFQALLLRIVPFAVTLVALLAAVAHLERAVRRRRRAFGPLTDRNML